jgi:hypothetical protein
MLTQGGGALGHAASRHLAQVVPGGYQLVISDLVGLECRVLPLNAKDPVQLRAIESFCSQPGIEQLGLDRETFLLAADMRWTRTRFSEGDELAIVGREFESFPEGFLASGLA